MLVFRLKSRSNLKYGLGIAPRPDPYIPIVATAEQVKIRGSRRAAYEPEPA